MSLPENVKLVFYEFLIGNISINEFEKWIYDYEAQLEVALPEFYFQLISFNYKAYNSKDLIHKLIYYSIINQSDFAEWQIKTLLNNIILNKNWELAVSTLYWEFWDDDTRFGFLKQIADYGAVMLFSPEKFGLNNLVDSKREKLSKELLYPEIVKEAESILKGFEDNEIQIISEKEYLDTRKENKLNKTFQQILVEVKAMINNDLNK